MKRSWRFLALAPLPTLVLALAAHRTEAYPDRAEQERWKVGIVVYDGMEILDFAGPGEVFAATGDHFEVFTVAERREPILSQGFVRILPDHTIGESPRPDILVIPGGGTRPLRESEAMMSWIGRTADQAEIVMTVCSGAFVLAQAGLLDGREATTWYGAIDHFRRAAPKTVVHENVRFVDNGKFITTAGVSAGIDGALHVVSKLLGPDPAEQTAAYMEYDKWVPGQGHVVESDENRRYAERQDRRLAREAERAVAAQVKDGVQVVRITASDEGYEPAAIRLRAGIPARLIFERQSGSICAAKLAIPDLGVEATELAAGEATAIEFTPVRSGRFTFACGMDMLRGALLVEG